MYCIFVQYVSGFTHYINNPGHLHAQFFDVVIPAHFMVKYNTQKCTFINSFQLF